MLASEQVGHAAEMRRCLVECDVTAARALWHHLAPKAPAPKTDYDALCCIHYARTITATIGLRLRSYSHHWLIDHGLPSGLPDELLEKSARLYPHIVDSVGLSSNSSFPEVASAVQAAMEGGVNDCYADNRREGLFVRSVVLERRAQAKKALHGILSEKATQDLLARTLQSLRKKGTD